jgi:predicted transglutaminase-like cysteine proteinase
VADVWSPHKEKTVWVVKMKKSIAQGVALLGLMLLPSIALAMDSNIEPISVVHPANAPVFGKSLPPVGYVEFCSHGEDECKNTGGKNQRLAMSPDNWNMLVQVNTYVNGKIKPESDQDLYHVAEKWTYPISAGDCEDYALLKKRYLQNMGFSADELLMTVLLDEKGDGHAVLTIVTDNGDFILDNRRDDILRWDQTPYKFLKRQSQQDPKQWVSLQKTSAQVLVSTKSK